MDHQALLAHAHEMRQLARIDAPMVIAEPGFIVVRPDPDDNWRPIMEATLLPLVAGHDNFIITFDAWLAPSDEVAPSQNPNSREVGFYLVFVDAKIESIHFAALHRDDDGTERYEPDLHPLSHPALMSGRMKRLQAFVSLFGGVARDRDPATEAMVAAKLASDGSVVAWSAP